jgi:TRAP-type C4-dicarboxylate transport system permease small subunit
MRRAGLVVGVLLIVVGLVLFRATITVSHRSRATYGVVDFPLEAIVFALVLVFAGVVILLAARR